jgi:hypothetical protein
VEAMEVAVAEASVMEVAAAEALEEATGVA